MRGSLAKADGARVREAGLGAFTRRFLRDRRGATVIEYAILIFALSLVILVGVGEATNAVKVLFLDQGNQLVRY